MLTVRPNFWFETDQVEFKLSTCNNALDDLRKIVFTASGQEDSYSVFLFHAQFDQLNHLLIPPPSPCASLFNIGPFSSCRQNVLVVPPAAIGKALVSLKIANCRPVP